MIRAAAAATALLLLSACTAQQGFESLKSREQNLCVQGPAVQYEDCIARVARHQCRRKFCNDP